MSPLLRAAAFAALLALAGAPAAAQQQGPAPGTSEDYLDMIPSQTGESWLTRQFSEFSSYPVIDKAIRLAEEGSTGAARNELTTFLADHPENLRARFMLAVLLYSMAEYQQSVDQMGTFLKDLPDFGPGHLYRGLALAEMGSDPDLALDDLNAALGSAQVSEDDRRNATDVFIQTAIEAGRFEEALSQLERQSDKDTYRFQRLRGLVLDGMERYDEARADFIRASELAADDEDRLEVLKFAAESARKQGDAEGARTILLDALATRPGDYTIMRQLAWVELSTGNNEKAWEWIMLALDSDPDVETRIYLINLLIEANDPQGALGLLDRQIADAEDETLRRQLIDTKFNLLIQQTVITPHMMAGVYHTRDDTTRQTVFETGPGISIKYWFDDTKYEAYRSAAEGIIQYRAGFEDNGDFSHGIVATLLVSF